MTAAFTCKVGSRSVRNRRTCGIVHIRVAIDGTEKSRPQGAASSLGGGDYRRPVAPDRRGLGRQISHPRCGRQGSGQRHAARSDSNRRRSHDRRRDNRRHPVVRQDRRSPRPQPRRRAIEPIPTRQTDNGQGLAVKQSRRPFLSLLTAVEDDREDRAVAEPSYLPIHLAPCCRSMSARDAGPRGVMEPWSRAGTRPQKKEELVPQPHLIAYAQWRSIVVVASFFLVLFLSVRSVKLLIAVSPGAGSGPAVPGPPRANVRLTSPHLPGGPKELIASLPGGVSTGRCHGCQTRRVEVRRLVEAIDAGSHKAISLRFCSKRCRTEHNEVADWEAHT